MCSNKYAMQPLLYIIFKNSSVVVDLLRDRYDVPRLELSIILFMPTSPGCVRKDIMFYVCLSVRPFVRSSVQTGRYLISHVS